MKCILFVIFASTNYYNDYMLINFSFGNFRSFRDIKSLRMEAGRVEDLSDSVIEKEGFRLLPVAAIYGANSSGKTNVIKALGWFRYIVRNNTKLNPDSFIPQNPFMLDMQTKASPTVFEIQFLLDSAVYRYGFEYLPTKIVSEWLYERKIEPNSKEHVLFLRQGEDFTISTKYFPEGKNKKELTTKNRLFLSLVAQLNGEVSQKLISYFKCCNTISGLEGEGYKQFSLKMLANKLDGYAQAINLFKKLDLGFTELEVEEFKISDETKEKIATLQDVNLKKTLESREYDIYTTHHVYDKEGKVVGQTRFNAEIFESNGTNKIISFSGPLFDTLLKGKVLFVDELDAKLHPMLTPTPRGHSSCLPLTTRICLIRRSIFAVIRSIFAVIRCGSPRKMPPKQATSIRFLNSRSAMTAISRKIILRAVMVPFLSSDNHRHNHEEDHKEPQALS